MLLHKPTVHVVRPPTNAATVVCEALRLVGWSASVWMAPGDHAGLTTVSEGAPATPPVSAQDSNGGRPDGVGTVGMAVCCDDGQENDHGIRRSKFCSYQTPPRW